MAQIKLYIQPKASKTDLAGSHGGLPKIRLAAPPVDGAVNTALIEYVAARVGVAKSQVQIVRGHSSRRKLVTVQGVQQSALDAAFTRP